MPAERSILLVEDDQDVREAIQQALEFEGYQVRTARHGDEALQALRTGTRPALILLDLMMPVMDGWEFLKRRAEQPELTGTPVIVFSAAGDRATPSGVSAIIRKPVDLDVLSESVRPYFS
jgi:CheY-like chemotaxis protein